MGCVMELVLPDGCPSAHNLIILNGMTKFLIFVGVNDSFSGGFRE